MHGQVGCAYASYAYHAWTGARVRWSYEFLCVFLTGPGGCFLPGQWPHLPTRSGPNQFGFWGKWPTHVVTYFRVHVACGRTMADSDGKWGERFFGRPKGSTGPYGATFLRTKELLGRGLAAVGNRSNIRYECEGQKAPASVGHICGPTIVGKLCSSSTWVRY